MKIVLIFIHIFIFAACSDKSSDVSGLVGSALDTAQSLDSVKPVLRSVSSPDSSTYIFEDKLSFVLEFDEEVMVNGSPRIEFVISGVSKFAVYESGGGSKFITLSYSVEEGQQDFDGVEYSVVDLNGGGISDASSNIADLSVFTSGTLNSVLIDSVRPTADSFTATGITTYTTSSGINLDLLATGAAQMYITTDTTCLVGGSWEVFSSTKSYTLSDNTINNLYFIVKNTSGNKSQCLNLTITHDNLAPDAPGVLALAGDGSDIASDTTSWSAVLDNGPSGLGNYEYAVSTTIDETGIVPGGSWVDTLDTNYQIESGLNLVGGTDYYVLVRSVDLAGNTSSITASSS